MPAPFGVPGVPGIPGIPGIPASGTGRAAPKLYTFQPGSLALPSGVDFARNSPRQYRDVAGALQIAPIDVPAPDYDPSHNWLGIVWGSELLVNQAKDVLNPPDTSLLLKYWTNGAAHDESPAGSGGALSPGAVLDLATNQVALAAVGWDAKVGSPYRVYRLDTTGVTDGSTNYAYPDCAPGNRQPHAFGVIARAVAGGSPVGTPKVMNRPLESSYSAPLSQAAFDLAHVDNYTPYAIDNDPVAYPNASNNDGPVIAVPPGWTVYFLAFQYVETNNLAGGLDDAIPPLATGNAIGSAPELMSFPAQGKRIRVTIETGQDTYSFDDWSVPDLARPGRRVWSGDGAGGTPSLMRANADEHVKSVRIARASPPTAITFFNRIFDGPNVTLESIGFTRLGEGEAATVVSNSVSFTAQATPVAYLSTDLGTADHAITVTRLAVGDSANFDAAVRVANPYWFLGLTTDQGHLCIVEVKAGVQRLIAWHKYTSTGGEVMKLGVVGNAASAWLNGVLVIDGAGFSQDLAGFTRCGFVVNETASPAIDTFRAEKL